MACPTISKLATPEEKRGLWVCLLLLLNPSKINASDNHLLFFFLFLCHHLILERTPKEFHSKKCVKIVMWSTFFVKKKPPFNLVIIATTRNKVNNKSKSCSFSRLFLWRLRKKIDAIYIVWNFLPLPPSTHIHYKAGPPSPEKLEGSRKNKEGGSLMRNN